MCWIWSRQPDTPGTADTPVQMPVRICFRMNGGPFPLTLSPVLPRIFSSMAFGQSFSSRAEGCEWLAAQLGPQLAFVYSCFRAHWPGGEAAVISAVKIKSVASQASQVVWEEWKIQALFSWHDTLSVSEVFHWEKWDEIFSNQA